MLDAAECLGARLQSLVIMDNAYALAFSGIKIERGSEFGETFGILLTLGIAERARASRIRNIAILSEGTTASSEQRGLIVQLVGLNNAYGTHVHCLGIFCTFYNYFAALVVHLFRKLICLSH